VTNVLCVAAHPDDESLGCGGTLAKHALNGDNVYVMFMTDGVGARQPNDDSLQQRRDASIKACRALGVTPMWANTLLPDNAMDSVPLLEVVRRIEKAPYPAPDIIYTHHGGDLNVDHVITHKAVMTAFRPKPGSSVKAIYCFEVPSSTEWAPSSSPQFNPRHHVNITGAPGEKKIEALNVYRMEMLAWPHARSMMGIRALMQWRGASRGFDAAEAFVVERSIA
jgi:LmbE family N-acetylglucosaminyl deacetylase